MSFSMGEACPPPLPWTPEFQRSLKNEEENVGLVGWKAGPHGDPVEGWGMREAVGTVMSLKSRKANYHGSTAAAIFGLSHK